MIIDTEKIRTAIFEGQAKDAAERTGISENTIDGYRANEKAKGYRDWQGMSLRKAIEILNKLEEKKMKKDRLEVSEFFGPKRRQISAAIDEALWEAKLYDENYFEKQYNQVDSFRDGLSKETIHDTQAVILYVGGTPNIVDCDGIEAIYTDDDEGPDGGYEQVLRKVQITDLETSDEIHILLAVDI